jgi:hypothetical protein
MSCVLPGVCEVLAKPFLPVSILISDDLPTFDRPIKAYSGFIGGGSLDTWLLLQINSADLITIVQR